MHDILAKRKLKEIERQLQYEAAYLFNIFPHPLPTDRHDDWDVFSEQGRKGGYGKTLLLTECRKIIFQDPSVSKETIDEEDATANVVFPIIELSECTTKEAILKKVVENLLIIAKTKAQVSVSL